MPARPHPPTTAPPAPASAAAAHTFPREHRSVGRARDVLREQLARWHIDADIADSALLLLSELATNAVRAQPAGCRTIGVRFELARRTLRLEVSDGSGARPALRRAAGDDECGRGLVLVDALADRWGVEPLGPVAVGKVVWAQLTLPGGSPAPPSAADRSSEPQTGVTP